MQACLVIPLYRSEWRKPCTQQKTCVPKNEGPIGVLADGTLETVQSAQIKMHSHLLEPILV